jgi:arylsulfatase A-like enzyme
MRTLAFLALLLLPAAFGRPNIVFLLADDQTYTSIGCYGNKDVQTPEMDRLGADGLIFDRHYNTTAICMASRANVFTGMYEYKTGCNFGYGDLSAAAWARSYPLLLRKAGYLTAFAGKFGIVVEGTGQALSAADFDFWGGGPGQTHYATAKNKSMAKYAAKYPHATRAYGAFGQDVIKAAAEQKRPFCLSISFKAPHRPVTPDPAFDLVYASKTFTKPANYGREHGRHFSEQSRQGRQYERFESWDYDKDYDGVMAKYHQQIYAIDKALGMIRAELDRQKLADNTVIIYTSDNGFLCGAHGYGSKVLPIEESARAPLIILDPRSPSAGKGWRCSALTGNIDFAPSILELAGLPKPDNMDGVSLLPLLRTPQSDVREQLAFINVWGPAATHSLTALTKRWKYTYWAYDDDKMDPTEDLFDLSRDPLEMSNLAGNPEYASQLARMRTQYDDHLSAWRKGTVHAKYAKFDETFARPR